MAFVFAVLASGCGPRLERGPKDVDIPYDRPDYDEFTERVDALMKRRDWPAVRELAKAQLASDPKHVYALVVLAYVAWATGDVDASHRLHREALVLDPLHFGARWFLAQLLRAQDGYAESLAVLEPLEAEYADNPDMWWSQLTADYVLLNVEHGLQVAERMARRAASDEPFDVSARARANFLAAIANETPLVEIAGVRADARLEPNPGSSGWRTFMMIGGERRSVLLSPINTESWIDTELAESLGLPVLGTTQPFGRVEGAVTVIPELETTEHEVAAGDGLRISRVPAVVTDLDSLAAVEPGLAIDVVLGWQVLRRFGAITIDEPRGTLGLEVAVPSGPPSDAVVRPLLVLDALFVQAPVTPIAINGSREQFWAWLECVGDSALSIEQQSYLASGAAIDQLDAWVLLDEIAFGEVRIANLTAVVEREPDFLKLVENATGFDVGGCINKDLLAPMRTTWVPSRAAIWIEDLDHERWLPEVL